MTKQDEVLKEVDLILGADAMSSFVYYDRHNKVDFAGRLDAPSPLVKDFQLHRPTYERRLRPTMCSVEWGRLHVLVN